MEDILPIRKIIPEEPKRDAITDEMLELAEAFFPDDIDGEE